MADENISREIEKLAKSINTLNQSGFIKMHSTWLRFTWASFVRGVFMGLGTAIGATVVLYFAVQFLSRMDFIPVIGGWASEVVDIINGEKP